MQKDPPKVTLTNLPGVLLLTPILYTDTRGFFSEIYNEETFASLGIDTPFTQDSVSFSNKNVIRGLHFQLKPYEQAKLVRCAAGRIYDVVVDIDPSSPTYRMHVGIELSGDTQQMLYIPGHYAHGLCVLSETATVVYKLTGVHNPSYARGVSYNDPEFNINWPVTDPILSEKDKNWPLLETL